MILAIFVFSRSSTIIVQHDLLFINGMLGKNYQTMFPLFKSSFSILTRAIHLQSLELFIRAGIVWSSSSQNCSTWNNFIRIVFFQTYD